MNHCRSTVRQGPPRSRLLRAASGLVAVVILVAGVGELRGQARSVRPGEAVQRAQFELRHSIDKLLAALSPGEGAWVACYGMTDPFFLKALAESVGPEGRVSAVYRNLLEYREASLTAGATERIEVIFAADGDAHLEPSALDLVILLDVNGFFKRQPDLYRQARNSLRPGGRLAILKLVSTEERQRLASGAPPSAKGEVGRAALLRSNRAIVEVERLGFVLEEEPEVLSYRTMRIFRLKEGSVRDQGDGPT